MALADLIAELKQRVPALADLPDAEIEARVVKEDPRMQKAFDTERTSAGVKSPERIPTSLPEREAIPDPTTFEQRTPEATIQRGLPIGATRGVMDPIDAPEALPMLGSVIGSKAGNVVGAPLGPWGVYGGGVLGAGVIGGAGEAARLGIRKGLGQEPNLTWDDFARRVRDESLMQGGTEAVGGVVTKGLQKTAQGLMSLAGRPTKAMLREFPTVIQDALERGAKFSTRGEAAAGAAAKAGGEQADELIAAAQKAGAQPLNLRKDVIRPAVRGVAKDTNLAAELGEPAGRKMLKKRVTRLENEFRRPPPRPEPPPPPTPAEIRQQAFLGTRTARPIGDPTGSLQVPEAIENIAEQKMQLGPQFSLAPASVFKPSGHEVQTALELGPQAALVPKRMIVGPEGPVPGLQVTGEQLQGLFGAAPTPPALPEFRDVTLTRAQELKRKAQALASRAYRAQERGAVINETGIKFNEALARALREGLEKNVTGKTAAGQTLKEVNEETQKRLGVAKLVEEARLRPSGSLGNLGTAALVGGTSTAGYQAYQGDPQEAAAALALGVLGKSATGPRGLAAAARGAYKMAPHQATLYKALLEAFRDRSPEPPEE